MVKPIMLRAIVKAFVILVFSLMVVGTAFAAWVNLPLVHGCAPTQGNFSWTEPYPSTYVEWYQDEKWTGSQYNCIHGAGNWYQLETEGYNPASGGSSCDKLHAIYTNYTLPVRSFPTISNGCMLSSYKEEVKFYISSGGIGNGSAYWTFVRFNKVSPYVPGAHEVNWSFANLTSDYNMAKIGYNISSGGGYSAYCSNPLGILTGKPNC